MHNSIKVNFLFLIAVLILGSSCNTGKNVTYFKDLSESKVDEITTTATSYQDPIVRPKDILQINVQTLDQQNKTFVQTENDIKSEQGSGYLVSNDGTIEMLYIGSVKVAGLTTKEVEKLIYQRISALYKDPIVTVRLANFMITVLGEVNEPGQKLVTNEKVSILDALGMAHDMTIYGKRENVLLITEENGVKKFVRFDLNSSKIFQSKYFYLRQNDIVYVEPGKVKMANADVRTVRNISILTSLLSIAVVLIVNTSK